MKTDTIVIPINYPKELDSQRDELGAYRALGSVAYVKYLKKQHIQRKRRARKIKQTLEKVMFWTIFLVDLWIALSLFSLLCYNSGLNFFNLFF